MLPLWPVGARAVHVEDKRVRRRAAHSMLDQASRRVHDAVGQRPDATAQRLVADDVSDTELGRRCVWLQLGDGFGAVFARVCGAPSDPLVLYVHGSGADNSSLFWNALVPQTAALLRTSHFHVAFDCPGYGRSAGDRQTIRSYPAKLIAAVVRACGKRRAAALVGSSQGCAAIFNAVIDAPSLADRLAACDPVGHAVERYAALPHPALLVVDAEDAGHPVGVARRMHRALQRPTYFEYAASVDGDWRAANMAAGLAKHLAAPSPWAPPRQPALPERSRPAGGYRVWARPHGRETAGPLRRRWLGGGVGAAPQLAVIS